MEYQRIRDNYYQLNPDAGERALPALTALLDGENPASALELRYAVQLWLQSFNDEAKACSVASVYPVWRAGCDYAAGEILRYGYNELGDAQLYRVLQAHKSQSDWIPDVTESLYVPLGRSEDGLPLWIQPLGAVDAYQSGDMVVYLDKKYVSCVDGNVWSPEAYPTGWKEICE